MRGAWTWRRAAAIAIGGSVGATVRWAVLTAFAAEGFPWPVFALNALGSLLLGALLAEESGHPARRVLLHDAGAIGFCGGLTTFSTFAVEVAELMRAGDAAIAATYLVSSVLASIAAVLAGTTILRRLRAVRLPLEEQP